MTEVPLSIFMTFCYVVMVLFNLKLQLDLNKSKREKANASSELFSAREELVSVYGENIKLIEKNSTLRETMFYLNMKNGRLDALLKEYEAGSDDEGDEE